MGGDRHHLSSVEKERGDFRGAKTTPPNSVTPERVFSVLNDTFEDDMDRSHADYSELSLQLQYNGRSRNM